MVSQFFPLCKIAAFLSRFRILILLLFLALLRIGMVCACTFPFLHEYVFLPMYLPVIAFYVR